MRPSATRDRLHAAVVALALCCTAVSIVVAGQPDVDAAGAGRADHPRSESVAAVRSFTDLITEAAHEQARLSAAARSGECAAVADAPSIPDRASTGAHAAQDGAAAPPACDKALAPAPP